jgi:tetratricopeptide (TPR) repeat protein
LAFFAESLSIARAMKNKFAMADIVRVMGDINMALEHYAQAKTFFEESMVLFREVGTYRQVALLLNRLGRVARLQGEYELAARLYTEGQQLATTRNRRQYTAWCLAGLAELAALRHQPQKAARLLGAANAVPELYIDLWPFERLELEQMAGTIRDGMDEATFETAQAEGRAMTLEQAIELALEQN